MRSPMTMPSNQCNPLREDDEENEGELRTTSYLLARPFKVAFLPLYVDLMISNTTCTILAETTDTHNMNRVSSIGVELDELM